MKTRATQMNLIVPEKLRLELHQVSNPNTPPQVLQLSSEKIAIEIHQPPDTRPVKTSLWIRIGKGVWLFIKDLLPPLSSAIIAFFVFYYGKQFNDRQAKSQEEASRSQSRQADTGQAELQLKILSDFTSSIAELTDESVDREKKQ